MVREMQQQGLISPAPYSHFCSPLLVVPKPNGDIRMIVDYRTLNTYIKPYVYPLTTADDIFSRSGGCTRFSTLDFKSWFYQHSLSERSKQCTTFSTPTMGTWQWNVLPMGLNISPPIVQAMIDNVFRRQRSASTNA